MLARSKSAFVWLCSFAVLASFAPSAGAQTALTGGLRGSVTDPSGGTLAAVEVAVTSPSLGYRKTVTTDAAGRFVLMGLVPAGDYQAAFSARGFAPSSRPALAVSAGDMTTLDAELSVVSFAEEVAVEAAPEVRTELSQAVDATQLDRLPSATRNLTKLALLNAHVRNTAALGADGFNATRLSINANTFRDTHHKLDGASNVDAIFNNAPLQPVALAAVQEFKILTNQFSAEHGGTSAGMTISTTRSGTDELHGALYTYGRPDALQARPLLADRNVPGSQFQAGVSLGGALSPGRTYFFANYETLGQTRSSFVNSPAPLTYTGHYREHLGLVRLDHRLSAGQTLSLRVNGSRNRNDNVSDRVSGLIQPSAAQAGLTQAIGAQVWHTAALGRGVNEARVGYVNSVPSNTISLEPQVGVVRPGYSTEGSSAFSYVRMQVWQLADQFSLTAGAHSLKVGGDVVRRDLRDTAHSLFGEYRFAPGAPTPGEQPLLFTQRFGRFDAEYGQTQFAVFVQDDWRATSRLTLKAGLRYEYLDVLDDANNLAPRLSFSYDLKGDGATVVRGGAGVFNDMPFLHGLTQRYLLNGPVSPAPTYTLAAGAAGFPTFPASLDAPPPSAALPRRSLFVRGEKLLNPYTSQFSLGVERRLAPGWTVSGDVIHSLKVKDLMAYNLNAPAPFVRMEPGQVRSVADTDRSRPFDTFEGVPVANVLESANGGSSHYDSLDLGLRGALGASGRMEAHYVYSSAINNLTDDHHGSNPNEWSDVTRGERGPSDFHQRHRFVAYGTADLPAAFNVSLVVTLASGLPVNAVTGVDNNGDTTVVDRPVGVGRNTFRTPAHQTVDLSLARSVRVAGRARAELRVSAFNLFNHSNYYRLNNVYGNGATPLATFLTPLAGVANVDPGRQLQFAARLEF